jgi:hypothetical protein
MADFFLSREIGVSPGHGLGQPRDDRLFIDGRAQTTLRRV